MIKNDSGFCNDESCKCDCHVGSSFRRGNRKRQYCQKNNSMTTKSVQNNQFLDLMDDLSILRTTLKQKSHPHIMKTKTTQSREVTLTVNKVWGLATSTWNKIRSSKLTIKINPIQKDTSTSF